VTPVAPISLDDAELDALSELVNLGVSRAAASLRQMIGAEVVLSVPSIEIMSSERATRLMGEREAGRLVAVHQLFEGGFAGRALLIFPEANSLELIRAITGGSLSLEEVIGLEQEALAETGNVILNGCLATIANMLHQTVTVSLPEIISGSGKEIINISLQPFIDSTVLFLYIDFTVRDHEIQGYIAMLMDVPSLAIVKTLLGRLIAQTAEQTTDRDAHGAS
jgi:chemotaxis protein CheC